MAAWVKGHTWNSPHPLTPQLLSAFESKALLCYSSKRIVIPHWVLDYNFQGASRYRVGDTDRQWKKRPTATGHLYAPGIPFWEDTGAAMPVEFHSTHITFLGGEEIGLDRLTAPPFRFARFQDPQGRLGALLRELAATGSTWGDRGLCKAHALFYQTMDLLLQSARCDDNESFKIYGPQDSLPAGGLAVGVQEYLKRHYRDPIRLADLADALGVSLSSLCHRYRQETGEAPIKTLARFRVNIAKTWLLRGHGLKTIAHMTGFCDAFHLSRTFKRVEGISPQQYLKHARQTPMLPMSGAKIDAS